MPISDILDAHVHIVGSKTPPDIANSGDEQIVLLGPLFDTPLIVDGDHAVATALTSSVNNSFSTASGSFAYNLSHLTAASSAAFGDTTNHLVLVGGPRHNPVSEALTSTPIAGSSFSSNFLEDDQAPALFSRELVFNTGVGVVTARFTDRADGQLLGASSPQLVLKNGSNTLIFPQTSSSGLYFFRGIIGRIFAGPRSLLWIAGTRDISTRGTIIALTQSGCFADLQETELCVVTVTQADTLYQPNIPMENIQVVSVENLLS